MVENESWNQEGLTVPAGHFSDSAVRKAREVYERGRRELEKGETEKAITLFEEALECDPHYLKAWNNLGITRSRLEQWEAAQEAFDGALALAPDDAEILLNKGMCQVHAGLVQDAIETFATAVEKGQPLEAHFQLGLLLARESQRRPKFRQQAIGHFEDILEAVDAGRDYPALDRVCFTLGGLYGDDSENRGLAIKAYRRGLAVNPLSPVGHNSLGLLLMQSGQVLGALGEFKVAIQLDPSFRTPYTNLAELLFLHVKPADLAQEYEHIIEEFEERAPQVLAHLSLELGELATRQVYEGIYTKGHQLKNLLGIVGSRMRSLVRRVRGEENTWGDELTTVSSEHERLYEEWVGFLGAMKPERVHPAIVEPTRLARRVVEVVKSQPWMSRLQVRVQEGVPRIEADERMLREAITNLCLNALEVCEGNGGGSVTLGVGYDSQRSGIFVEIEDDGSGIAGEVLEHIFDPGFTTKKKGNGYGLSIARRIVHAHHGELRVKSRVGHGTVFRMDLPLNFEGGGSDEGLARAYLEKM